MVRTIMAPLSPAIARMTGGYVAGPEGPAVAGLPGGVQSSLPPMEDNDAGRMMDIARVNGQVQARSIERIGSIVKENPAATVSILRQWIADGA